MYVFVLDIILKQRNITIKELSIATGISESYISEIKNNRVKNVNLDKIIIIAEYLNEDWKDFLFAVSEFSKVQALMHKAIDNYGVNSPQAYRYSQILDKLFLLKQQKED